MKMRNTTLSILAACGLLALSTGALAGEKMMDKGMADTKTMSGDSMAKEGKMMKDEGMMKKDEMAKDGMMKDSMAKEEMMTKEGMADGKMDKKM